MDQNSVISSWKFHLHFKFWKTFRLPFFPCRSKRKVSKDERKFLLTWLLCLYKLGFSTFRSMVGRTGMKISNFNFLTLNTFFIALNFFIPSNSLRPTTMSWWQSTLPSHVSWLCSVFAFNLTLLFSRKIPFEIYLETAFYFSIRWSTKHVNNINKQRI